MAVVRTCELGARIVPLNMSSEIIIITTSFIIIIIIIIISGGGGFVLYFASYWLERELLCINNVANFSSISLLNCYWKMRIYSKHMDPVGVRR